MRKPDDSIHYDGPSHAGDPSLDPMTVPRASGDDDFKAKYGHSRETMESLSPKTFGPGGTMERAAQDRARHTAQRGRGGFDSQSGLLNAQIGPQTQETLDRIKAEHRNTILGAPDPRDEIGARLKASFQDPVQYDGLGNPIGEDGRPALGYWQMMAYNLRTFAGLDSAILPDWMTEPDWKDVRERYKSPEWGRFNPKNITMGAALIPVSMRKHLVDGLRQAVYNTIDGRMRGHRNDYIRAQIEEREAPYMIGFDDRAPGDSVLHRGGRWLAGLMGADMDVLHPFERERVQADTERLVQDMAAGGLSASHPLVSVMGMDAVRQMSPEEMENELAGLVAAHQVVYDDSQPDGFYIRQRVDEEATLLWLNPSQIAAELAESSAHYNNYLDTYGPFRDSVNLTTREGFSERGVTGAADVLAHNMYNFTITKMGPLAIAVLLDLKFGGTGGFVGALKKGGAVVATMETADLHNAAIEAGHHPAEALKNTAIFGPLIYAGEMGVGAPVMGHLYQRAVGQAVSGHASSAILANMATQYAIATTQQAVALTEHNRGDPRTMWTEIGILAADNILDVAAPIGLMGGGTATYGHMRHQRYPKQSRMKVNAPTLELAYSPEGGRPLAEGFTDPNRPTVAMPEQIGQPLETESDKSVAVTLGKGSVQEGTLDSVRKKVKIAADHFGFRKVSATIDGMTEWAKTHNVAAQRLAELNDRLEMPGRLEDILKSLDYAVHEVLGVSRDVELTPAEARALVGLAGTAYHMTKRSDAKTRSHSLKGRTKTGNIDLHEIRRQQQAIQDEKKRKWDEEKKRRVKPPKPESEEKAEPEQKPTEVKQGAPVVEEPVANVIMLPAPEERSQLPVRQEPATETPPVPSDETPVVQAEEIQERGDGLIGDAEITIEQVNALLDGSASAKEIDNLLRVLIDAQYEMEVFLAQLPENHPLYPHYAKRLNDFIGEFNDLYSKMNRAAFDALAREDPGYEGVDRKAVPKEDRQAPQLEAPAAQEEPAPPPEAPAAEEAVASEAIAEGMQEEMPAPETEETSQEPAQEAQPAQEPEATPEAETSQEAPEAAQEERPGESVEEEIGDVAAQVEESVQERPPDAFDAALDPEKKPTIHDSIQTNRQKRKKAQADTAKESESEPRSPVKKANKREQVSQKAKADVDAAAVPDTLEGQARAKAAQLAKRLATEWGRLVEKVPTHVRPVMRQAREYFAELNAFIKKRQEEIVHRRTLLATLNDVESGLDARTAVWELLQLEAYLARAEGRKGLLRDLFFAQEMEDYNLKLQGIALAHDRAMARGDLEEAHKISNIVADSILDLSIKGKAKSPAVQAERQDAIRDMKQLYAQLTAHETSAAEMAQQDGGERLNDMRQRQDEALNNRDFEASENVVREAREHRLAQADAHRQAANHRGAMQSTVADMREWRKKSVNERDLYQVDITQGRVEQTVQIIQTTGGAKPVTRVTPVGRTLAQYIQHLKDGEYAQADALERQAQQDLENQNRELVNAELRASLASRVALWMENRHELHQRHQDAEAEHIAEFDRMSEAMAVEQELISASHNMIPINHLGEVRYGHPQGSEQLSQTEWKRRVQNSLDDLAEAPQRAESDAALVERIGEGASTLPVTKQTRNAVIEAVQAWPQTLRRMWRILGDQKRDIVHVFRNASELSEAMHRLGYEEAFVDSVMREADPTFIPDYGLVVVANKHTIPNHAMLTNSLFMLAWNQFEGHPVLAQMIDVSLRKPHPSGYGRHVNQLGTDLDRALNNPEMMQTGMEEANQALQLLKEQVAYHKTPKSKWGGNINNEIWHVLTNPRAGEVIQKALMLVYNRPVTQGEAALAWGFALAKQLGQTSRSIDGGMMSAALASTMQEESVKNPHGDGTEVFYGFLNAIMDSIMALEEGHILAHEDQLGLYRQIARDLAIAGQTTDKRLESFAGSQQDRPSMQAVPSKPVWGHPYINKFLPKWLRAFTQDVLPVWVNSDQDVADMKEKAAILEMAVGLVIDADAPEGISIQDVAAERTPGIHLEAAQALAEEMGEIPGVDLTHEPGAVSPDGVADILTHMMADLSQEVARLESEWETRGRAKAFEMEYKQNKEGFDKARTDAIRKNTTPQDALDGDDLNVIKGQIAATLFSDDHVEKANTGLVAAGREQEGALRAILKLRSLFQGNKTARAELANALYKFNNFKRAGQSLTEVIASDITLMQEHFVSDAQKAFLYLLDGGHPMATENILKTALVTDTEHLGDALWEAIRQHDQRAYERFTQEAARRIADALSAADNTNIQEQRHAREEHHELLDLIEEAAEMSKDKHHHEARRDAEMVASVEREIAAEAQQVINTRGLNDIRTDVGRKGMHMTQLAEMLRVASSNKNLTEAQWRRLYVLGRMGEIAANYSAVGPALGAQVAYEATQGNPAAIDIMARAIRLHGRAQGRALDYAQRRALMRAGKGGLRYGPAKARPQARGKVSSEVKRIVEEQGRPHESLTPYEVYREEYLADVMPESDMDMDPNMAAAPEDQAVVEMDAELRTEQQKEVNEINQGEVKPNPDLSEKWLGSIAALEYAPNAEEYNKAVEQANAVYEGIVGAYLQQVEALQDAIRDEKSTKKERVAEGKKLRAIAAVLESAHQDGRSMDRRRKGQDGFYNPLLFVDIARALKNLGQAAAFNVGRWSHLVLTTTREILQDRMDAVMEAIENRAGLKQTLSGWWEGLTDKIVPGREAARLVDEGEYVPADMDMNLWHRGKAVVDATLAKVFDLIDIESKIGYPGTGRALKMLPTMQTNIENDMMERMAGVADALRDEIEATNRTRFEKDALYEKVQWTAALLAESPDDIEFAGQLFTNRDGIVDSEGLQMANLLASWLRQTLDDIQQQYKDRGVNLDFMGNERKRLGKRLAKAKAKKQKKLVSHLTAQLKNLEGKEYVPVLRAWFAHNYIKNPRKAEQVARLLNAQEREVKTIRDLLDIYYKIEDGEMVPAKFGEEGAFPIFTGEEFNVFDIMKTYTRRYAEDMSMLNVFGVARREGLIYRGQSNPLDPLGFWMERENDHIFEGYKMNPELSKFLDDYYAVQQDPNAWDRLVTSIKMMSFIQPWRMWINDAVQGSWLQGWQMLNMQRLLQSAEDVLFKSDRYGMAREHGLFPKPYRNPFRTMTDTIDKMKRTNFQNGMDLVKRMLNPVNDFWYAMNVLHTITWKGDEIFRMQSYNYMMERLALDSQTAAQIGAAVHGDYAMLPPKTRRIMNRYLYVPNFTLAMGKLQAQAAAQLVDRIINRDKLTEEDVQRYLNRDSLLEVDMDFIREAIDWKKATRMIGSRIALGTLGWNLATHSIMWGLFGFEPEIFGYRYKRDYEDDEGEPQQLVINILGPQTLFQRYVMRPLLAYQTADRGEGVARALRGYAGTIQPAFHIAHDVFISNQQGVSGEPIVKPGDSALQGLIKQSWYLLGRSARLLNAPATLMNEELNTDPFRDPGADAARREQLGPAFNVLAAAFGGSYSRDPDHIRLQKRARATLREAERQIRAERWTPEDAEAAMRHILDMYEAYDSEGFFELLQDQRYWEAFNLFNPLSQKRLFRQWDAPLSAER